MRHGGQILVHQLKAQQCERVFAVPGDHTASILDGLYENAKLQTITCRNQSSAAIMAEAHGQMSDTPGVCLVSGLFGAIKAAPGLQCAQANGSPMLLIVGLPATNLMNRGTTQELDFTSYFSQSSKYCAIVENAARLPEYINRAWHIAISGRPGPAILAIPTDIQEQRAHTEDIKQARLAKASASEADIQDFKQMLESASRPLMVVGGTGWNKQVSQNILVFAEKFDIPLIAAYRCQDYINNHHTHYVGHAGSDISPQLAANLKQADLVIALGTELNETTTQNDKLLRAPQPDRQLIHIHPDPNELGRVYQADLMINAHAEQFAHKIAQLPSPEIIYWSEWRSDARKGYESYLIPNDTPGDVKLEYIVRVINEAAPEDCIITYGSGTYSEWLHRYYQFRHCKSQLAPKADIAEYALPAAIAAKLANNERTLIAITGDGGFLANCGELATLMHYGLKIILLVINNNMYGSARLHQEQKFPNRVLGTSLSNPDILKLAESFGLSSEIVTHRKTFRTILKRALKAPGSTVIHLPVDQNAISTKHSLNDLNMDY